MLAFFWLQHKSHNRFPKGGADATHFFSPDTLSPGIHSKTSASNTTSDIVVYVTVNIDGLPSQNQTMTITNGTSESNHLTIVNGTHFISINSNVITACLPSMDTYSNYTF